MILAYCVVGVFIVIVTATLVCYICANRDVWCVKVKKRKVVKKRERREEIIISSTPSAANHRHW
jgi:hypothetical protein